MDDMAVSQLGAAKARVLLSENSVVAPSSQFEILLRLPQVIEKTGLSRATIYRLIAAGQFPRQVKLSQRVSAWSSRAIASWIADRVNSAA